MGCDIHMWAEVKKRDGWQIVGEEFDNPYYNPKSETGTFDDGSPYNEPKHAHPYDQRNYSLYAILANVRNGYGFAGLDTGDGFQIISPPRGIPSDATEEYLKEVKNWGADGHSHSWLYLSEILAFDWNQTTVRRGVVKPDQYIIFKKDGKPKEWCAWASGPTTKIISNEEMDEFLQSGTQYDKGSLYTQVSWKEEYYECAGKDWWQAVEKLKEISVGKKLRLVFFFDN